MIDDTYVEYINFTPLSNRTKELYIRAYNSYWKEKIGNLEIVDLDYNIIQSGLTELVSRYAYGTLKVYKCSILKYLEVATSKGVRNNSFDPQTLNIGRIAPKKDFNTNGHELDELLCYLEKGHSKNKEKFIMAIWIGYYTGMRIGEVFALRKEDIDLDKEIIEVKHNVTIVSIGGKETAVLSNTKTASSVRTIYIPRELKKKLTSYMDKIEGDILLPDNKGNYIIPGRLSSYICNFAHPRGYTIHFHVLRAMYVKRFISTGENVEIVRCLIGHKSVTTVLDMYLRTNGQERKEAVDRVFG